jgi:hypothetical protein
MIYLVPKTILPECKTFLPDICQVTSFKGSQVSPQAALINDLVVSLFVERCPKEDIILHVSQYRDCRNVKLSIP